MSDEEAGSKYPHLWAVLVDTRRVVLRWNFDEQQADPIHQGWSTDKMKSELRRLLKEAQ